MSERRALGPAGGARSIEDRRHLFLVDRGFGRRRCVGEQRLERLGAGRLTFKRKHVLDRRHGILPRQSIGERRFDKHRLRASMTDHIFEFGRLKPVAERHRNRAEPRASEHGNREIQTIARIERNSVARVDAKAVRKIAGDSVDQRVERAQG